MARGKQLMALGAIAATLGATVHLSPLRSRRLVEVRETPEMTRQRLAAELRHAQTALDKARTPGSLRKAARRVEVLNRLLKEATDG